jgi:cytoskeletal protein CcmA (bactofilin family)
VGIKDFFGFEKSPENQNEQNNAGFAAGAENASGGVEQPDDDISEWTQPVHDGGTADHNDRDNNLVIFDDIPGAGDGFGEGASYHHTPEADQNDELSVSTIASEASVTGNILTSGHIEIVGKVNGDIEAKGNVAVQGMVKGNVSGEKIGLYECSVKGDLEANVGIVADSGSTVIGDIHAKNVIFDGKLKGDIKADNVVVLRSNAYYVGDVITDSLVIESGAVINGNVKMLVDGDLNAPFDE